MKAGKVFYLHTVDYPAAAKIPVETLQAKLRGLARSNKKKVR
jgi:hypothetical protein